MTLLVGVDGVSAVVVSVTLLVGVDGVPDIGVSVPLLFGVDGVPAVGVSFPLQVGSVVSLQKLATVVFPYRWGKKNTGYVNNIECSMFNLAH